ncbi:hypothetical protein FPL14_04855 [Cohnella cholangitidis]|uniref:Butirosin biosynthesis protein H N-terminal domain-containing protein n=2 Tax=Cohnella cholangitidis TaxID=2598458 RepID=A0A7G5BUH3_9BACL|nr:hypothetical protein FPL14_04855 [Cohnella cholangitidis]
MINLAYMECFASCVLTYLNFNGDDYRKVLLDYWNLNYQFRTLLSSKDARQIPLDLFYGIEMKFIKGDSKTLNQSVRGGSAAICFCQASKLDYFPRENLGMESSGFQHSILIYGWDQSGEKYVVGDPTVSAIVQMNPDEVLKAGAVKKGRDELHYFVLTKPSIPYSPPDIKSCIRKSAQRNLYYYGNSDGEAVPLANETTPEERRRREWQQWFSNRKSGAKALEAFEADFVQSAVWAPEARVAWMKRNAITIASIRRIRSAVWQAYIETGCIGENRLREGKEQIDSISGLWNTISFKLLKALKEQDTALSDQALSPLIAKLKQAEIRFMEWLILVAEEGD